MKGGLQPNTYGSVLCLCLLIKHLGIKVNRIVSKFIKGSIHENHVEELQAYNVVKVNC